MRKLIITGLLVLLSISLIQIPAFAGTPTVYSMETRGDLPMDSILFDLFFLRPMGIAACAVGLATSVVAAPFALTSGTGGEVGERLITEPFEYTFRRPLGYDY